MVLLFSAGSLLGQSRSLTEEEMRAAIAADRTLATGFRHHYDIPTISDTPAPKGYKPFYISHFSRHGERYYTRLSSYDDAIEPLERMDAAGLLTAKGEQLLSDLHFLRDETSGMEGMLTQRGAATHRGISARMYGRYSGVFRQKGRDSVVCISTPVPRCILSMTNFTQTLKEKQPKLHLFYDTGERYRDYLNSQESRNLPEEAVYRKRDSLYSNFFPVKEMLSPLLTDLDAAKALCGSSLEGLCRHIAGALDITNCLDGPQPEVFSYVPFEAAWYYWFDANARIIINCANSVEFGNPGPRVIGRPLLRDFIEKADRAIGEDASPEGQRVCADFRFGHDNGLMPLVSLLNLDGLGEPIEAYKEPWRFPAPKVIPMGSNVQMIFFRGRRGDVLVKILLDETEATVPALADVAVNGVYYPWEQLRAYFVSKL